MSLSTITKNNISSFKLLKIIDRGTGSNWYTISLQYISISSISLQYYSRRKNDNPDVKRRILGNSREQWNGKTIFLGILLCILQLSSVALFKHNTIELQHKSPTSFKTIFVRFLKIQPTMESGSSVVKTNSKSSTVLYSNFNDLTTR